MKRKEILKKLINLVLKNFKEFKVYKNNYINYLIKWDGYTYLTIQLKNNKYNLYDTFHLGNDGFELLEKLAINMPFKTGSVIDNQVEYINNIK